MRDFKFLSTLILCFPLIFFYTNTFSQTPTQTVRGKVVSSTNEPLVSAGISLVNTSFSTLSDTEGVFILEKIPVGVYTLSVSYMGYKPLNIPAVRVETGKETVLTIPLTADDINLDAVTVKANQGYNPNKLTVTNQLPNSLLRFPATFNDPARAISYLAGAAVDNDQANNISVRGNTPNALQWYLEGAEIVNPNHLSNAGTPSDRSTANGGGVLILGTNLMENATFHKGAMSADMGGALTSIMDLRLRKGNDQKRQTTLSIGLIGIEAGSEGYFNKGDSRGGGSEKASYLIHYRYSTIGLLSKMGVPLGDEAITFQDISYNFNLPTKKAGNFNVFGIHGFSDNVFKHKAFADWETEKDSQDITYTNAMHAVGLRHTINFGKNMNWTTVGAYSTYKNTRSVSNFNRNDVVLGKGSEIDELGKLFIKTTLQNNYKQGKMQYGLAVKTENLPAYNFSDTWIQPFAEWQGYINERFKYHLGLRGVILTKADEKAIEPTLGATYQFDNNSRLSLNISQQSQSLSPIVYNFIKSIVSSSITTEMHRTQSSNINLNYLFAISSRLQLDMGAFYQRIKNAPSLVGDINYYTVLDGLELNGIWQLDMLSKGHTKGLELDLNHLPTQNGFHGRFNVTLYDSKIMSINTAEKERNARFNGRYIVNGLIGKEWQYGKNQNKFFGVNLHQILRGGFWETPINETASIKANETTYDYSKIFALQLKDYVRTDLSVYLKKSRQKWASTLQLDIQNVMNTQNEAWHYYDTFQKKVVTKYQLGMIPNLSYKVEF